MLSATATRLMTKYFNHRTTSPGLTWKPGSQRATSLIETKASFRQTSFVLLNHLGTSHPRPSILTQEQSPLSSVYPTAAAYHVQQEEHPYSPRLHQNVLEPRQSILIR